MRSNLGPLYMMEVFAGFARGSYLACIGWTTLLISNDVGRVGQMVIIAMLTNIFVGPVIGVIVDRQNRKHVIIAAHIAIALILFAMGGVWLQSPDPALIWLFLTAFAVTSLRLLHHVAHDGLIKTNVAEVMLVNALARFRMVHLLFTAAGMAGAGAVIELVSPSAGFVTSGAASVLLILPMIFVKGVVRKENTPGLTGFIRDFADGFEIFRTDPAVRMVTLLAAVSLPVGQLINTLLSSFIRDDLNLGSSAFGIVDSAWAIGGMAAAAMLSLSLRALSANNMEYLFSALAGVMTICFALFTAVPMLALLHGAMGWTVWMCRIMIDSRILQASGPERVGRTKVYVEVVFSLSAMVMCFSPTLITLPRTADYFTLWGGVMVMGSLVLWAAKHNATKRLAG